MTLNLRSTVSTCSLFVACFMGMASANAADVIPNDSSISAMKGDTISLSTRRNRNCFTCVGPRGDRGCPGPKGDSGIAGLANVAAYENIFTGGTTTFNAASAISFGTQAVLIGDAIQSSPPFDSFTLAQGDYQIDVGVSNGNTLTTDLQLQVFLNNMTIPIFVWPATPGTPNPAGNKSPGYIEFSTIISAPNQGAANFLRIVPTGTVTITGTGPANRTISFINILKLDRDDNLVEENCGS